MIISIVYWFTAGLSHQPPMVPQQQPQYTNSSRGIDHDEMVNRDHSDGHDQYSRGRVSSENRSHRPQYDAPRETESPNVSIPFGYSSLFSPV